MNTPITDDVYPPEIIDHEYRLQGDTYGWGTLNKMRNTARRLETDRAALIEALSSVLKYSTPTASARIAAATALAAARKQFPAL